METIRKLGMLAFASRLKRLSERLMQDVGLLYQNEGLAFEPRWFLVFYQLKEKSPMTVTEIAEAVGITHPAVNQVSGELERAGLITSASDQRDKRKRLLALSPDGVRLVEKLRPIWQDIEAATREVVETTGVDFIRSVEAIEAALGKQSIYDRVAGRIRQRKGERIRIEEYSPKHRDRFKALNLAWLEKHFHVEENDREVLNDPENQIVAAGGQVFFAVFGAEVVGTCALIRTGAEAMELSKMAVDERWRGKGIGEALARHALQAAQAGGATTVFLYTSPKLKAAVSLYKKLGFQPTPGRGEEHYERPSIRMELRI